jgi:hypothetical protein
VNVLDHARTMGLDQTSSVAVRKQLYATLVGEVQDLEQNGHSFFLQLIDDWQMLIYNECKYGFCSFDIRVDLGIKGEDRLIVCRMVAWDEGSTQLQKRRDTLRSCCSVRGRVCSRRTIEAQRPRNFWRDRFALLENGC